MIHSVSTYVQKDTNGYWRDSLLLAHTELLSLSILQIIRLQLIKQGRCCHGGSSSWIGLQ
jgi:hypothetical protein